MNDQKRAWVWGMAAATLLNGCVIAYQILAWSRTRPRPRPATTPGDEEDIPDNYVDVISHGVMQDMPVVLAATGQLYDRSSLRSWFEFGNLRCPKTNLRVMDAQVVPLPWLRAQIHAWLRQQGKPVPKSNEVTMEELTALHPTIAGHVAAMRMDSSGAVRAAAVGSLAHSLRVWQDAEPDAAAQAAQARVRGAVLDEVVHLLRYGDPYQQGVAASVLAACSTEHELRWLSACAVYPLVAALHSSSAYTQEWALQVLYKLCVQCQTSHDPLWQSGGACALLNLIALDKSQVPFHRDRAAVALATMAGCSSTVQSWLKAHGLRPLERMVLNSTDRWERRDAAFALLVLELTDDDLTPPVDMDFLRRYRWCSQAWLDGKVDEPDEGLSEAEVARRARYEDGNVTEDAASGGAEGQGEGEGDDGPEEGLAAVPAELGVPAVPAPAPAHGAEGDERGEGEGQQPRPVEDGEGV